VLGGVAFGFAVFTLVVSSLLGKPRPNPAKSSVYECGIPPVSTARERFPIKFYLVCMIFILLDVDAAFLYPWALVFRELGVFGFVEMLVFVGLLGGGFVYAWRVGALDW
jgi:NADH-quinone oxidoreductase subunit A